MVLLVRTAAMINEKIHEKLLGDHFPNYLPWEILRQENKGAEGDW